MDSAAESTLVTWADAADSTALRRFRELREIIAADPHNEAAIAAALELARENQWPNETCDLLARLVQLRPEDASRRFELATQLMRLERWIAAIRHLRMLAETDAADARVWYNLAVAHQSAGHLHDARRAWDRVVELSPDSADAHAHRGEILLDLRDWEAAIGDFRRVLELEPESLGAAMNLSLALSGAGRVAEARGVLAPFLPKNPRNVPLLNRLAETTWTLCESNPSRRTKLSREVRSYCERSLAIVSDQPDVKALLKRAGP